MNVGKAAAALRGPSGITTNPTTLVGTTPVTPAPLQKTYATTSRQFVSDASSRGSKITNVSINVNDNFSIGDLNVVLKVSHTWISDLTFRLIGPDGTTVNLVQRRGGNGDNLMVTIDDQATGRISRVTTAITISGSYRGEQALSAFRGKSAQGRWTLQVIDQARGDTGFVNSFQLQITPNAVATSAANSLANFAGASGSNVSSTTLDQAFAGFDFNEWLSRITRNRESISNIVRSTQNAVNSIIDRIFSNW